ncbi:uncharacterized protein LOC131329354 [Rhododendron vialii]|uniref:uncharacterized protein LOC131329354 n=1 Tax=Rhododendron vialii TaxID=182163 RepID=UPI00265DEFE3|nr:uncharacterized protein LOC131329354 [Rhododendron vialii]
MMVKSSRCRSNGNTTVWRSSNHIYERSIGFDIRKDKILEVETEHCTEAGVTPMRSFQSSRSRQNQDMLKDWVQEYQKELQAQQQKIDVLLESNKQMELTTATIMEYLKHQGNGLSEYIESSRST